MASILSTGIIILEDHTADPLTGITRTGRHNGPTKRVNKVSLRQITVSTRHRQSFRHYRRINVDRKGIMP